MFIGVDGVIVNHRNACGLTPTVSKVSSGALEFIPLYSARFVSKFMDEAQRGIHKFKIISTDIQSSNDESSGPIKEVEVQPVVPDDSEDDEDDSMFGGDSKILKEIKKERKQQETVVKQPEPESESEEGEEDNPNAPFKAPQVISIDELRLRTEDNIVLVLGSEGEGVSRSINRLADHRVMIPPQLSKDHIGKYPFNMVDSLNVGVSAGLLIYHIRHLTKRQ
jgi:tRNA G18 (ribose-2'-O)-methylase SpoU